MGAPLDMFRALADEVRLRILGSLLVAELSVAELVEVLGLPQSTVSRHLKPLREAGLAETRREGTSVYYRRGALVEEADLAALLDHRLGQLPTAVRDAAAVEVRIEIAFDSIEGLRQQRQQMAARLAQKFLT